MKQQEEQDQTIRKTSRSHSILSHYSMTDASEREKKN